MALVRAHLPVGIVVRRAPGVTRWARWSWRVSAVLPGAAQADWRELRREGDTVEYHAATLPLELWSSDTEAYCLALESRVPGVTVVMQPDNRPDAAMPWRPTHITASVHEGQDYGDAGEAILEYVPMPPALVAWVKDFIDTHHRNEAFVKRRRDSKRVDLVEDGIGDPRIRQVSDVYRAPHPEQRKAAG